MCFMGRVCGILWEGMGGRATELPWAPQNWKKMETIPRVGYIVSFCDYLNRHGVTANGVTLKKFAIDKHVFRVYNRRRR